MKTASLLLAAALSLATSPLNAQTHELLTGEVLIGPVTAIDATHVDIQVGKADAARRIPRTDFAPTALYRILRARAMPSSVDAHVRLAEEAKMLGLELHAIAELRAARELDPKIASTIDQRIQLLRNRIADRIADEASEFLKMERPAKAKLHAEVLLDKYSDTPAGKQAEKLLMGALDKLMESSGKPVDEKTLLRAIRKAEGYEARADKLGIRLNGAVRFSNKDKQQRERAIRYLEKAWQKLGDVRPDQGVAAANSDRYSQLRARVREKLGAHYLAIGNVLVQRLALPSAEEYNARACELDPHGGGCKLLQSRIIEARISRGGFGN